MHSPPMPYTLTAPQKQFVKRLVKQGRFNNESEVVRAGVRLLEEKEASYLNPPPLPPGALEKAYARETRAEREAELRRVRKSVQKPEAR